MKKDDILKDLKDSHRQKIKFAVADIDGILREKTIHIEKFIESLEKNIGFCNVIFGWDSNDACYDNCSYTGLHTGYPDARAKIDLNTYRKLPWDNDTPFFLADLIDEDESGLTICPRSLLKNIDGQCRAMDLIPLFSLEYEWYNFNENPQQLAEKNYKDLKPLTPGMFGYSMLRPSLNNDYFNAIFDWLEKFDIKLEGMHTETGPGVYEAAIYYDEILNAADKAILFKTSVKEIAYRFGIIASFMAKWNEKFPGCGGHIHQSLWNKEKTVNLFVDKSETHKMSELMKSYIAGQLKCLPEILPMYAPNVNSYKRLAGGSWAPNTITWGIDNRTTAVRVLNNYPKSVRIEMRVPGADINPYLAMAASLASGLYGVKNKLKLEHPAITGNGYIKSNENKLPSNLIEAVNQMKKSALAKELFGPEFVDHFANTRIWEWEKFSGQVTDWELKRYFEII